MPIKVVRGIIQSNGQSGSSGAKSAQQAATAGGQIKIARHPASSDPLVNAVRNHGVSAERNEQLRSEKSAKTVANRVRDRLTLEGEGRDAHAGLSSSFARAHFVN